MSQGKEKIKKPYPSKEPPLLDKRTFEYLLGLEVRKASRYMYYFSLLSGQLDSSGKKDEKPLGFEQDLGRIMKEEVRETDLLGEGKEDNYMIVLQYADLENAVTVGHRIRERVDHYNFKSSSQKNHRTVSVGISCFPTSANDYNELVRKASENMEVARKQGGNKVFLPL